MTDEPTPPDPTPPAPPPVPERSWSPEPAAAPEPAAPAWAEPPAGDGDSAENEYDAWLDAQDLTPDPGADEEPAQSPSEAAREDEVAPVDVAAPLDEAAAAEEAAPGSGAAAPVTAPVVVPDGLEAAATPLAVEPEAGAAGEPAGGAPAEEPVPDAAAPAERVVEPQASSAAAEPDPVVGLEVVAAPEAVASVIAAAQTAVPETVVTEPAALETAVPETAVPEPAATPVAALPMEEEPGEEPPVAVPASRSGAWLVAPLAVLVALLVGLTAFLGVWASRTSGGGDAERARADAIKAARDAARVVFSYDYRHLAKDFAAGKAVTTGSFASDYARTTSKLVDDVAARYKAVVVADVSDAAVVSSSASRVEVLLFVNQRSTSSLAAGQKITQSRLTMTMERKGGRWLVSQVKAF